MTNRIISVLGVLATIALAGCGGNQDYVPTPVSKGPHGNRDNVKVVDADGQLIGRLKADHKGYKVYNDEGLIARLKVAEDHIKVVQSEDEGAKAVFRLKRRGKKYKTWVAENEEKIVQFVFSESEDGGYELSDGYGALMYTVRHQKYGFDVYGSKGELLARMKIGDDKVIGEGPDGKRKLEMKGSQSAIAASAYALEGLDLPHRAALFAFLHQMEAGELPEGM